MRTLGVIESVMLVIAGFSRHTSLLDQCEKRLAGLFGPTALSGPTIEFRNTAYYEATMGPNLLKRYWAFARFPQPDELAHIKRRTIELEQEIMRSGQFAETRPINLDPGFLTLGKFVLATTKDQAHRIYLHGGIFAEVTLRYHEGEFEPRPWTYADWQLPQVHAFLKEARRHYSHHKDSTRNTTLELPALLVRDTSQP